MTRVFSDEGPLGATDGAHPRVKSEERSPAIKKEGDFYEKEQMTLELPRLAVEFFIADPTAFSATC